VAVKHMFVHMMDIRFRGKIIIIIHIKLSYEACPIPLVIVSGKKN